MQNKKHFKQKSSEFVTEQLIEMATPMRINNVVNTTYIHLCQTLSITDRVNH